MSTTAQLAESGGFGERDAVGRVELSLIRGFRVVHDGNVVNLPPGAQRVLAYLALHDRPVLRAAVAGILWQDAAQRRAGASLRSALWRLNRPGLRLVDATVTSLCLAPHVCVDLQRIEELAHDVLERRAPSDVSGRPAQSFRGDFLPDWPDDWVLIERERFRQLRLHVLEALCDQLTEAGRFGEAVDAGLAAVAAEPLRESAHRAVMRAYLAEGNRGEALRQYDLYRQLAHAELGVAPSAAMRALVAYTTPAGSRTV